VADPMKVTSPARWTPVMLLLVVGFLLVRLSLHLFLIYALVVLLFVRRRKRLQAQRAAWIQTAGGDGLKPLQHAAREHLDKMVSALGTQVQWSTGPNRRRSSTLVLVGEVPSISLGVALEDCQFSYTLGNTYDYMEWVDYDSPAAMTDAFLSSLEAAMRRRGSLP